MVSIVGTPTLRRPFRRPSDARGGDWSEYAVYYVAVAPLAQRLEQRPFKSWVVGSNPTGGTLLSLENLWFNGFQGFPLSPSRISGSRRPHPELITIAGISVRQTANTPKPGPHTFGVAQFDEMLDFENRTYVRTISVFWGIPHYMQWMSARNATTGSVY